MSYFEWQLPKGSALRQGEFIKIDPKDVSVEQNYMLKCRAVNSVGFSEWTTTDLSSLKIEACPSTSSFGLIIGLSVILLIILLAVFVIWWRKLFCCAPKGDKEGDYILDNIPTYGNSNVVKDAGIKYDYQPAPPSTKPPNSDDESDEETAHHSEKLIKQDYNRYIFP